MRERERAKAEDALEGDRADDREWRRRCSLLWRVSSLRLVDLCHP